MQQYKRIVYHQTKRETKWQRSFTGKLKYSEPPWGEGGYPEAIVRILLAIMTANQELILREYARLETVSQNSGQLEQLTPVRLQKMIKKQSRFLQVDRDERLKSLLLLIPDDNDRASAMEMINNYTKAIKRPLKTEEQRVIAVVERQLIGQSDDCQ